MTRSTARADGVDRDASIQAELTVCFCTRNRPEELQDAVDSVRAAVPPVAAIVVSDDSTDDRTRALVAAMADVTYLEGPRLGLGANRNTALTAVRTSHVAFLDDDAHLNPRFVSIWRRAVTGTAAAQRDHTIYTGGELNGGVVVYPHGVTFLGYQSRPFGPGEPLSTIVINATVFPARLFDDMAFDDLLVYGSDEIDIIVRARAAGYRVLAVPDLLNEHFPARSNREYYAPHIEAARLYVMWKRYARVERSLSRAALYGVVAPLHLLAHGLRRGGVAGARRSARAIWQAVHLAQGSR